MVSKIFGFRGAATEAKSRAKNDLERRSSATTILNPLDIANRKLPKSNAGSLLTTTLNGQSRPITKDDLVAFAKKVKDAQKSMQNGITAQQIIDLSLPIDRERANKQISSAVPYSVTKGVIHYVTSSAPGSKVSRHHVKVELLGFTPAAFSGKKAMLAARSIRDMPLKFDCDCGRHTFWYRYIATIGGFNFGRAESGYPKIRNPNLHGVACKHVLRAMRELSLGGSTLNMITKAVQAALDSEIGKQHKQVKLTQAQSKELARKQTKNKAKVETSEVKKVTNEARALHRKIKEVTRNAPPVKLSPQALEAALKILGNNEASKNLILAVAEHLKDVK